MSIDIRDYELMHYGVKGMRWGVRRLRDRVGERRAVNEKQKMDKKDHEWFQKNVRGFDLASARSRKLAGREIDRYHQTWKRYFRESNRGMIDNPKTRQLRAEFDKASLDMHNALISDLKAPSGRKPRYVRREGQKKLDLIFE